MVFSEYRKSAWLEVTLQRLFNVAYIEIYYRNESTLYRMTGFSIYAFYDGSFDPQSLDHGSLVYQHNPMTGCPPPIQNITINRLARHIVFNNQRPTGYQSTCPGKNNFPTNIEICEFRVMGCDFNRYSLGCKNTCSDRCKDQHCDAFNGSCRNGCQNHWTGDGCEVCNDGYYGTDCNIQCGHCKDNGVCDNIIGHCPNGCQNHWKEGKCDECEDHFYGIDCSIPCGHCNDNAVCNNLTGFCPNGCQNHWTGKKCNVCSDRFYGDDCDTPCGQCEDGAVCNNITGHCPNGCKNHWIGAKCDTCKEHFYGGDCKSECGHCKDRDVCHNITGDCPNGCQNQWTGMKCDECSNNFYGTKCDNPCGQCQNNSFCHNVTGHCPNGCEGHWQGDKCNECRDGFYNASCNQKCGNCNGGEACNKINGACLSGCSPEYQLPLCTEKLIYDPDDSKTNTGVIAGGIVSVLIIILTVGIILVIYRRRRGNKEAVRGSDDQQKFDDLRKDRNRASSYEFVNETVPDDEGTYYNTAELNTVIRVGDLQRVLSEKTAGKITVFQSEYKRLPVGNTDICKEGKKQENISKNRFKTTFPYDHSRVVLKESWTDKDNDYINANFIKDFDGEIVYIASQGPKNNTLADFLRMIWQENVTFIVMLTNIIENGKNKCTQYWPEKDKPLEVGPCKIQLLKETTYAFYTQRKITVHNTKSSEKRTITQLHYTAWPDHGTPEEIGLIQFHRAVTRKYQPGGLMLVHCSAGVGRTGTFIGLDSLLKEGRKTGKINVFEFVKRMREDRMTMVQTPEQYVFLHKALLYGFQLKNTVVLKNDIPAKFDALLQDTSPFNQRTLNKEYTVLQTIKPTYDDKDKADGRKEENKKKNVNMEIIPVSKFRPYLTSYVNGRNDYINAVCVPSFLDADAIIITQIPLPDTEVDFWRLCMDHDVQAIVILIEHNEEIEFLPKRGSNRTCVPYTVTARDTGSEIMGISQDELVIARDGQNIEVSVLSLPVGNDTAMLKGVELLLEKEKANNYKYAIVSRDGAGPAGIFCVLHNALQQLRIDGEVDILTTVKLIQTRRSEVITRLEEYRKCYELILLSLSEDGIYANV